MLNDLTKRKQLVLFATAAVLVATLCVHEEDGIVSTSEQCELPSSLLAGSGFETTAAARREAISWKV